MLRNKKNMALHRTLYIGGLRSCCHCPACLCAQVYYGGAASEVPALCTNASLEKLEAWLAAKGAPTQGPFLVGATPTAPDFHLWELLDQLKVRTTTQYNGTRLATSFFCALTCAKFPPVVLVVGCSTPTSLCVAAAAFVGDLCPSRLPLLGRGQRLPSPG